MNLDRPTVSDNTPSAPQPYSAFSEEGGSPNGVERHLPKRIFRAVERHPVLAVFLVAFTARAVLALAITLFAGGTLFPDESGYNTLATDAAAGHTTNWGEGTEDYFNRNATLLVPLTLVYFIFGPRPIAGLLLVGLFGSLAAAGVTRLAKEMLNTRWAILAGLGAALLPSQVLWSSVVLKDAAVWAVLVGLAITVVVAGRTTGWRLLWPAAAIVSLLVLMAHLRIHTFIVMAWAMAIAIWFGGREGRLTRVAGGFLIALSLPWAFGTGPGGLDFVRSGAAHTDDIRTAMAYGATTAFIQARDTDTEGTVPPDEEITAIRRELEKTDRQLREVSRSHERARLTRQKTELEERLRDVTASEATISQDDDGVIRDLKHLPKGLSVMLFEPLPWRSYSNPNVQMIRLEMLVWYPLLLLAGVGLAKVWRHRRVLAYPVLVGGGIATMYALIEGNFGTAYRHRGEFVWVVAMLAATGAYTLYERVSRSQRSGSNA